MKKTFLLPLILTLIFFDANSQEFDSATLSKLKLNFIVPDIPAFKALGTDPSNLLRPSTPQALAVSMSSFNSNGKFIIPKNFAMEISPSLLLNGDKGPVGLEQYQKNAVVNSFRISLGSSEDTSLSSTGRNLALGLRINLINEGDLGFDLVEQKKIAAELRKFRKSVDFISKKEFAVSKGVPDIDSAALDLFVDSLKIEFRKYLENENEVNQKKFLTAFKKIKEEYKKQHWNDNKLDLAFSVLSSSPDSIVNNIRFNTAQFWLTWALKIGKSNKAQLLLGMNSKVAKNLKDTVVANKNKSFFNLSIPARFLLGTNKVKGFVEAQYSYDGEYKKSKTYLCMGAELNIIDGVWVNFSGGLDYNTKTSSTEFVANLNFKLSLPENFKFF